ncbi:tRNA (guanosine(46)-N7)-methyltransferase TrmB [Endozoicomonas sp. SM1973]|uniref:tRNA (guanine-N(7)-)-methyltransferase n=1 Tax=Spartinivicinus marinus TaxID=2994442 RepID=A0A853HVG9_9GAMM|nr:tRNA (guanosine(46)-N7)-methyltransferase TrmB [Spartinivicinus marinus]MCX4026572.1 tRNA (guanosine(46)-N7)-methyltransferase TrmB [Spartinivicinus marinus]NYZ64409.1 tRNA (guanosine(46)-N7)-methyltransferase TrmB [Spartinivicinus marinus]
MNQDQQSTKHLRQVKSYVLRAGRMTVGQQRGWDDVWPELGLTIDGGVQTMDELFGREAPLVLEIGFGMGHSLLKMAEQEPEKNFIGIEVHRPGVGSLLNEAQKAGLTNLRVYCDDAVEVLKHCIPDESIDRLQLYFPDPWHKKRHHKRRIVQPAFVQALRAKLKVNGLFHMATDWENYAEHMLEVMQEAEGFENTSTQNDYVARPNYRPITKFEKRGARLGHGVWDLVFKRIS